MNPTPWHNLGLKRHSNITMCAETSFSSVRTHLSDNNRTAFHPAYMFHRWFLVIMLLYCFYLYLIEYYILIE